MKTLYIAIINVIKEDDAPLHRMSQLFGNKNHSKRQKTHLVWATSETEVLTKLEAFYTAKDGTLGKTHKISVIDIEAVIE